MAYPTYPVNGTQADIDQYFKDLFATNPIDYTNIGGLYPVIPEFTIPVITSSGNLINADLIDWKRQQDIFELSNGDTSKLPKFEAAPENYTNDQKIQHYLFRMKDVGKWVDSFVQQAVEFDKTLRAEGIESGFKFGNLLATGGGASLAVQSLDESIAFAPKFGAQFGASVSSTGMIALQMFALAGAMFTVFSFISSVSTQQVNAQRIYYIRSNLNYCTDLYKKYDTLIKSLLPKDSSIGAKIKDFVLAPFTTNDQNANSRNSNNQTTNYTPVVILVVFLILRFIAKRHG